MNNLTNKIKYIFKKIKEFFIINPHKHWKVFLHLFAMITLVFVIFSFYLFFKIENEQVYESITVSPDKKIILKEKLLKQVLDSFEQKAKKTLELKGLNNQ